MDEFFERASSRVTDLTGQPRAFVIAFLIVVIWAVTGPVFDYSNTWQLVINTGTTIVTFLMVFLIQNAQNRDGAAIQCKLDELIRAVGHARDEFIGIEHLTERELRVIIAKLEAICGDEAEHRKTIERMLARR